MFFLEKGIAYEEPDEDAKFVLIPGLIVEGEFVVVESMMSLENTLF